MKIFGTRIIREKTYRDLLRFKNEVKDILKRKLPIVADKTLKNKNIILSKGLVLVNSTLMNSKIQHKSRYPIYAIGQTLTSGCFFNMEGGNKRK